MVYSLMYRRPSYVSSRASTISTTSTSAWSIQKPATATEAACPYLPNGVPEDLSFDRIISGKTCKPCTIRDFMNYLIYIEHSAENLQFFLWYRDYLMRFANIPPSEKALSPIWLDEKFDADFSKATSTAAGSSRPSTREKDIEVLPNFDLNLEHETATEDPTNEKADVVAEMPPSSPSKLHAMKAWDGASTIASSRRSDFRQVANEAFESYNIVAPFTVQPYREEITRIIATYIAEGAPRELNISDKERANLLRALASTTHPSAFGRVAATVETSLRRQSHPNFVRFAICNGDKPRISYATTMGWTNLAFGLIMGIILILSNVSRGWRAFSAFFILLGVSTLIMAARGICIVLNTFHQCHLQPWELFEEEPDSESVYEMDMKSTSFDTFGKSNSFEDQPWVSKYKQLPFLKKVFSRQTRINEPALRKLHDTMLLQSLLGALAVTSVVEIIFLAVPGGHFY